MASPDRPRWRTFKKVATVGAVTAVLGGAGLGVVACTDFLITAGQGNEQKLINDFSGNFNLVDLRTVPGFEFNGSVGGFIIFAGQINGETESMLQFAWKTRGNPQETIISEVPMNEVIFVVTPNVKSGEYNGPTLTFTLDPNKIPSGVFGPIDETNPNTIVDNDLKLVTISMSQQDFNSFRGTAAPTK